MGQDEAFWFAKDSNKRKMKCHNCGTPGHLAKDCRKTKTKQKVLFLL